MSAKFKERFGNSKVNKEAMRKYCQRPGARDENGKTIYFTEQNHKKECDVNEIINKYDKTGLINHVAQFEGRFGDLTGLDFKTMNDKITGAKSMFEELPTQIRKQFDNNPEKLLEFMEHSENRDEAIKLGLIKEETDPSLDGFGEHVIDGKIKKEIKETIIKEKEEKINKD